MSASALKVGTTWQALGGQTWEIVDKLPFGMFRVRRSDLGRVGEMSGVAIRAAIENAKLIKP